jgi:hypothetical protein
VITHLIVWILYASLQLCVYYQFNITREVFNEFFLESVLIFIAVAIHFYANAYWVLPNTFEKKRYLLALLSLPVFYCWIWGCMLSVDRLLNGENSISLRRSAISSSWWWFQWTLFSTGYWIAQLSVKREKHMGQQREEINRKKNVELVLTKEKLELENAYLRAQINPHFLFNTLGYFYNKTAVSQPDVAEGIAALTNIMRSSLKKKGPDGMVSLEEEVEHIESLISIYLMRFNNSIYVEYERPDSVSGYRILPHILITLVENAFKHGELHNQAHPLKIRLMLDENEGKLSFYIHNKKRIGPKEISNGIGMEYVQRQLDNVYKHNYSFEIQDTDLYYSLSLHINTTEITLHDQLLYN